MYIDVRVVHRCRAIMESWTSEINNFSEIAKTFNAFWHDYLPRPDTKLKRLNFRCSFSVPSSSKPSLDSAVRPKSTVHLVQVSKISHLILLSGSKMLIDEFQFCSRTAGSTWCERLSRWHWHAWAGRQRRTNRTKRAKRVRKIRFV